MEISRMKKSLFALAATTAFAGAAQAQSSVTVYGILDVGFTGSNSSVTAGATGTVASYNYGSYANLGYPGANLKTTQGQLTQSAEQTSRLGFKGNEDLGGGASAFFTAEFTLTPNDQTLSGNGNGGLKNRQTFVGLKKSGLGQFAVGTQYTPVHNAVAKTDPGQQNNLTGGAIYTGQGDSGVTGATGGNSNAYTTRVSNAITFQTDNYAGFQGNVLAVMNNVNATSIGPGISTGGTTNTNGWGLGADYTWNKFFATANYQSLKQLTSTTDLCASINGGAGTAGSTTACGYQLFKEGSGTIATSSIVLGTYAGQALNVQDNQMYAGATYDFGILKAYAQYITRKATDAAASGWYQKRSAGQIGVRSFITPTVEAWAMGGAGNFTPYGMNQNSAHFATWQLGSNYWLSKRTNLYAIIGAYNQSTAQYNVYSSTSGAIGATGTAAVNANSSAVGVRHTF